MYYKYNEYPISETADWTFACRALIKPCILVANVNYPVKTHIIIGLLVTKYKYSYTQMSKVTILI